MGIRDGRERIGGIRPVRRFLPNVELVRSPIPPARAVGIGSLQHLELQFQVLEAPNADCTGGWYWAPNQLNIREEATNWTYASYTFTTISNTHSIGIKFGLLFGDGNRTNPTDSFYGKRSAISWIRGRQTIGPNRESAPLRQ